MANHEREPKKYVVKKIGTSTQRRDVDVAIGERAANNLLRRIKRRSDVTKFLEKLSKT